MNSNTCPNQKILYIGGFELPDKNAAAQRVVGIAKALRELGYSVCFLNSLKNFGEKEQIKKEYFGFECYEYQRENEYDYLFKAKTVLSKIATIKPDIIFAYNYPAFALDKIRKYCVLNHIRCYADATEWYQAFGSNPIYRIIKNVDTRHRMKVVHKRLDGVIAISRYLYDYYNNCVNTVIIPPTVDISEEKWSISTEYNDNVVTFVYAGSPSAQKEKLDLIVSVIERIPSSCAILLNVVGVSAEQFLQMYGCNIVSSNRVKFWGRVEHRKVIEIIKQSDWSILLRENNKVVQAGFPTKLVESISCGTPVIVNDFSNIKDYLDETNSIMVSEILDIDKAVSKAINSSIQIRKDIFDYHQYMNQLKELLSNVECG